ncbi:class I adenylate-forming enzyme family protein [Pseudoalteromonas sp.]|uniref:class I adenylate-forming enzyme family protein n=1 Tax=Pseudoalteromonas sp. TaxID=53249 RepID=UPI0030032A1B
MGLLQMKLLVKPPSFFSQIKHHSALHPDEPAIVADGISLTYLDLFRLILVCASILKNNSISQKSIIGISIDDEVLHLICSLTLLALGAKQVNLATHDPQSVRIQLAEYVGVTDVLAVDEKYRLTNTGLVLLSAEMIFSHTGSLDKENLTLSTGHLEEQIYLRTSGTTGGLSIVRFTQEQIASQALRYSHYATERVLLPASIEHNNSKRHRLYTCFMGGTAVFRSPSSFSLPECCHRHNVTLIDISKLHAANLIWASSTCALDFPVTTKLAVGGSIVPSELRQQISKSVTTELSIIYGATEFGSVSTTNPNTHKVSESVGLPMNGVEVEIVDQNDKIMPSDMRGYVRLRAEGMATHYFKDPEKSARTFKDGWFYPGDMGSIKNNGELIIHGRQDDMIILNGINISPIEIESALEFHPAVKIAAAVGLSSSVHGQIPVAAVELYSNAVITAAELQAYSYKKLALRAPRKVLILDSLPTNEMGKVLKYKLSVLFSTEHLNE